MADFELRGLTTPEHEQDRWRNAAATIIDASLHSPNGAKVPASVILHFERGRILEVYANAPGRDRENLIIEATREFQEAAREGFGISG